MNSTFTQHSFHTSLLPLTELKASMYFLLVFGLSKALFYSGYFYLLVKTNFLKGRT